MASIFRQQTTRYTLDGRRVPAGTPGAVKTVTRSRKWYGEIPDPEGGRPLRVPLSTNRAASIQMLGQLLRDGGDPAAAHRRTPLSVHLDAFLAEIAGAPKGKARRPPSPETVRDTAARLRRVLLGRCGYDYAHQITLEGVQAALAALAEPAGLPELDRDSYGRAEAAALLGVGPETVAVHVRRWRLPQLGAGRGVRYPRETVRDLLGRRRGAAGWGPTVRHHAAQALRRFTAWLVRRGRLSRDPLAELQAGGTGGDHRHDRRPLTADQVLRLLAVARVSEVRFRGLAGEDRYHLYLTALSTGFRRDELAALTPDLFALDATPPVVRLPSAIDKAGRKTVQPLPGQVAAELRPYLAGREPGRPVWPGGWWRAAADMQRLDLEAAGIPYAVRGPDGPLYVDFHALRHTFVASLDRAGVSLKQAMQLARHSTPVLTARVYGRADLAELAAAVDRIEPAVTGMVTGACASQDHAASPPITPPPPDGPAQPLAPPGQSHGGSPPITTDHTAPRRGFEPRSPI